MTLSGDTAVAILTTTLLTLLCNNVQPIRAQDQCDDYPCFTGGTCYLAFIGSQSVPQPLCSTSCQSFQFGGSTCRNGMYCSDVCRCSNGLTPPTCDAEFAVYLSPLEISVTEGNTGNELVEINVCRQPSTMAITVAVATSQGSFQASSDYVPVNAAVAIPIGEACQPVNVEIISDTNFELTEEFHLSISSISVPANAYIIDGHMSATITIINDDVDCSHFPCFNGGFCSRDNQNNDGCSCQADFFLPFCTTSCQLIGSTCRNGGTCMDDVCQCPPNLAAPTCEAQFAAYLNPTSVRVTEGHVGQKYVRVQVCRQPSTADKTLQVYTSVTPNSAIRDVDFIEIPAMLSQEVTLAEGQTCRPVEVTIISDLLEEDDESFQLNLFSSDSDVYLVPGHQSTIITIVDDDPVTCADQPCLNGGICSPSNILKPCTCPEGFVQPFCTTNCNDAQCENGGTCTEDGVCSCFYTLAQPTCASVAAVYLSPLEVSVTEGNIGNRMVEINVCRQPSTNSVDVAVRTSQDSALASSDYVPINTGVTIPRGEACQPVDIEIISDTTFERTEEFHLSILLGTTASRSAYIIDGHMSATITVTNDDADETSPVIVGCPSDISRTVAIGDGHSNVFWNEPTANDNSGMATILSRSHIPGSSFTLGTTTVSYTFADPTGNEAICSFDVTVVEDCIALTGASQCNLNECSCDEGTSSCDSQRRCETTCSIFGCQATISSQPLSQVNPQSSVEIKCSLEGSTAVVERLDIRLSRSKDTTSDNRGFANTRPSMVIGGRRELMVAVQNVSEADVFYCILTENINIIGSVDVTGFVYKLPSILDPPTEVTRSATSITISWRSWDQGIDVGDPPVVAYIIYYRMDTSQDWINGSVIPADQSLEYTAPSLESDRYYTLSIVTVREGQGGEGPRGPPITIKTLCTEFLAGSVSSSITDSNDVSVSWKPPQNVDCSTGITQFTIYYEIEGDITTRQKAGTADATMQSFKVDESLLESGTTYNFYVTVTTDQEGAFSETTEDSQLMYITGGGSSSLPIIIGFVAFFIVILILILLIVIIVRKRRNDDAAEAVVPLNDIGVKSSGSGSGFSDHIYSNPAVTSLNVPVTDDHPGDDDDDGVDDGGDDNTAVHTADEASVADDIYGNLEPPAPIKISEFPEYIVNHTDDLEHEFLILNGANQIHPWTVAEMPVHKRKNRFKNMYPYDHSRVVLNRLPDQDNSDYYNASFVVNERNEKTYIACQAPNKASIDDFWRMIYEQNVQTVAMLTNLYEEGKDRCMRYWPSNESETQSFGYINVTWEKTQQCANYDIRTLSIDRGGQNRQIEQLHFKAWPDKLVPDDATSLVEFAKHCKLLHHGKSSTLLIHCSAGIGRTGTFIALYTMMDVLQTEEYIDVFGYVNKIRDDRINMIQTKEQYKYLHMCLYEYYLTKDFQVSANMLSRFKLQDSKASIVREFELLSELEEMSGTTDSAQEANSKNRKGTNRDRFGNMVPIMKNRVFMMSSSPSNPDNYINASFVKSYEKKDAFITTQSPLPNTIEDFWRMVYDHKCRTLVMLNEFDSSDKTCVQYWPDRGSLEYGIMTVTCIATEHQPVYTKRKFDISIDNSKDVLSVTHVQFVAWPPACNPKATIDAFIDIEKMQQEENDKKPPVVHCINGFERSGVFVTVRSEMERIRATSKVDVFTTVKKLRSEHQHMLRKKIDYVLCVELLILFTQKFGNYENW